MMGVMVSKCLYWLFTLVFSIFFLKVEFYKSYAIFSFMALFSFFFFAFYIKDTKDLSRKEMEYLYVDKIPKYIDRLAYKL